MECRRIEQARVTGAINVLDLKNKHPLTGQLLLK